MKHPLDAAAFATLINVTPEQTQRLEAFLNILHRWQRRINLVGSSTMEDPWRRHVLDSAQLVALLPPAARSLVDLGSGAGFPGLVLAILTNVPVTLVEADERKCAFLAEAARNTGTSVTILTRRIESASETVADVVTARALAPLPRLLDYALKWLAPNGICLFLKGRGVAAELTEAEKTWKMRADSIPSQSDPDAMILRIDQISRRV